MAEFFSVMRWANTILAIPVLTVMLITLKRWLFVLRLSLRMFGVAHFGFVLAAALLSARGIWIGAAPTPSSLAFTVPLLWSCVAALFAMREMLARRWIDRAGAEYENQKDWWQREKDLLRRAGVIREDNKVDGDGHGSGPGGTDEHHDRI